MSTTRTVLLQRHLRQFNAVMPRWLRAAAGRPPAVNRKRQRDPQQVALYTERRKRPQPRTLIQTRVQRAERTVVNEPYNTNLRDVAAELASTTHANNEPKNAIDAIDEYYAGSVEYLHQRQQQHAQHAPPAQQRQPPRRALPSGLPNPPTMPTLTITDLNNITSWRRELRLFIQQAHTYRQHHDPNYQIHLQDWVEPEAWFAISEQRVLTMHRTTPGTPSNDQAVENYLLRRGRYEPGIALRKTARKTQVGRPLITSSSDSASEDDNNLTDDEEHSSDTLEPTSTTSPTNTSEDESESETDGSSDGDC